MTLSVTSTDNAAAAAAASESALTAATSKNSALGKDAFLQLLVAQISHQNPLKPMDDTAFVAQLAQFSSLEQMIGVNTKLDTLAAGQQSMTNAGLASLIGKTVTVEGSKVALDGGQTGSPVTFTLASEAASVEVNIINSDGKTIRTMNLGPTSAGLVKGDWDGRDDQGARQPEGTYVVSVTAKTGTGASVDVSQETSGTLQSISYNNGTTTLDLSNGVSAAATSLLRVDAQSK